MKFAPVILFVYKRPDHLQQTLAHLKKNQGASETVLYIYSEGPKSDASATDLDAIRNVRQIIQELKGFKEIIINEAVKNIGCSDSITAGITQILDKHGRAIILEDDIITHHLFLNFCNKGLEEFEEDEKVMQIGTFMFPGTSKLPKTFLSRKVFGWGWATWRRAWNHLSRETKELTRQIKDRNLTHEFDLKGAYPYLQSLEAQTAGQIDTWDISWYASVFLKEGLSLYPSKSLSQNIGLDGSGTHYKGPTGNRIIPFEVMDEVIESISDAKILDPNQENKINKAVARWSNPHSMMKFKIKINNLLKGWKLRF